MRAAEHHALGLDEDLPALRALEAGHGRLALALGTGRGIRLVKLHMHLAGGSALPAGADVDDLPPLGADGGALLVQIASSANENPHSGADQGQPTNAGDPPARAAVDPLPEPTGGWEANAKLGKKRATTPLIEWNNEAITEKPVNGIVMDKATAAVMMVNITNKTSPLNMAKVFMSIKYPNAGLIRCKKVFYKFNGKCWREIQDDMVRSDIVWHFMQLELATSKISNILTFVEDMTNIEELQNNTWLSGKLDGDRTLVFNNEVVTLGETIVRMNHTRDYFCLNQLDYNYNPDADCPELLKFLHSIWDDPKMILSFQEMLGYCLTTETKLQKIILLVGKPRAGKSIITEMMGKMLGEHNVCSPMLDTIIQNSMICAMSKAKLISIPEATTLHPSIANRVLGILKSISGGDNLDFDVKYKDGGSNNKWGKIIITTNSIPDFVDSSGALANRFWSFPFTKSFLGREDVGLADRIAKEIESGGILNYAIEGLIRLSANGFKPTMADSSIEMVDDLKREMFPLADFVDDYCDIENDAEALKNDLHKAYLHWAAMKEIKTPLTVIKFGKLLKSSYLPVTPARLNNGRGFTGIKVKPLVAEKIHLTRKPAMGDVVKFPAVPVPAPAPITG